MYVVTVVTNLKCFFFLGFLFVCLFFSSPRANFKSGSAGVLFLRVAKRRRREKKKMAIARFARSPCRSRASPPPAGDGLQTVENPPFRCSKATGADKDVLNFHSDRVGFNQTTHERRTRGELRRRKGYFLKYRHTHTHKANKKTLLCNNVLM